MLKGKTAIVTGGSRGIGEAIAYKLASMGADIIIVDIGDPARAQSACVLMQDAMTEGKLPVYTGLNNVKFRSPVKPGDTVETQCRIKRAKHPFYFAEGTVTVEGRLCVSAEFSFCITGE